MFESLGVGLFYGVLFVDFNMDVGGIFFDFIFFDVVSRFVYSMYLVNEIVFIGMFLYGGSIIMIFLMDGEEFGIFLFIGFNNLLFVRMVVIGDGEWF